MPHFCLIFSQTEKGVFSDCWKLSKFAEGCRCCWLFTNHSTLLSLSQVNNNDNVRLTFGLSFTYKKVLSRVGSSNASGSELKNTIISMWFKLRSLEYIEGKHAYFLTTAAALYVYSFVVHSFSFMCLPLSDYLNHYSNWMKPP